MYCPGCGQEHMSNQVRFCSRCGINLNAVSHVMATGGLVPVVQPPPEDPLAEMTPRQRGIRLGAKILFASIVAFPIALGLSIAVDGPAPLLLPVVLFLIGALRMLYARMFEFDRKPPVSYTPVMQAPWQSHALPSYQSPVDVPRPGRTTGELAEPPSVTEHTTRFLDHE